MASTHMSPNPSLFMSHINTSSIWKIIPSFSIKGLPSSSSSSPPPPSITTKTSSLHLNRFNYQKQPKVLSESWRETHGSNDWEGLLDPLDPLLREEIIRYGEFTNVCYKAFDLDPNSKRYLNCKHGKRTLLQHYSCNNSDSDSSSVDYEVTKYIYAVSDSGPNTSTGRWVGYVAVASSDREIRRLGRRDIVVSFRGTVTCSEWIANFMSSLTPARLNPIEPRVELKVESGLLGIYTSSDRNSRLGYMSCREQLLSEVARLVNLYKHEDMSVTLTGHSLGSSLAMLFAYDLAELGLNIVVGKNTNGDIPIPITVYSFAGPRVGNLEFKKRCEELGVKVLRIVNVNDPITKMPGVFLNENFDFNFNPWRSCCHAHVGVALALDFFKVRDPVCVHDLEHMIQLLRCPVRRRSTPTTTRRRMRMFRFWIRLFGKRLLLMSLTWFNHLWITRNPNLVYMCEMTLRRLARPPCKDNRHKSRNGC